MDKGKSPFCVEGEGEGALAQNISVLAAAPSALETLAIPESGQFDQTTSTNFMQIWHGIGTMLDSSEWNIADRKAYSEALGSKTDPSALDYNAERSGKDLLPVSLDMGKSLSASPSSLFMEMGGKTSVMTSPLPPPLAKNLTANSNEELSVRHLGSQVFDGSSSSNPKPLASSSMLLSSILTRRNYTMEDLANLDPKRARRIMTNRKSAAKCKEKKKRQTSELEQEAQNLQKEITRLSTELDITGRQKSSLTFENKDLQLRIEIVEERAKLQDELTRVLQAEVYRLQALSGQGILFNGSYFI